MTLIGYASFDAREVQGTLLLSCELAPLVCLSSLLCVQQPAWTVVPAQQLHPLRGRALICTAGCILSMCSEGSYVLEKPSVLEAFLP
jgi:hypothetical protein